MEPNDPIGASNTDISPVSRAAAMVALMISILLGSAAGTF